MLRQKADGEEPDFDAFKEKWGQNFPGVESLDQLIEQMGRQMAAMQSLMQSLSPEQRKQLDEMMRSLMLQDERLEAQMRQLAMNLRSSSPSTRWPSAIRSRATRRSRCRRPCGSWRRCSRWTSSSARSAGSARWRTSRRSIREQVEQLLGPEAAEDLQQLQELTKRLEDAGYLRAGGRRAVADRAGHPQDRRPGAARRLRRAQARPHRRPRHPAPRRRRRPDRRDQGLRVRRPVPARPQGDGDERRRADRARARRSASRRTTSRSTAPSCAPRRPPWSCST